VRLRCPYGRTRRARRVREMLLVLGTTTGDAHHLRPRWTNTCYVNNTSRGTQQQCLAPSSPWFSQLHPRQLAEAWIVRHLHCTHTFAPALLHVSACPAASHPTERWVQRKVLATTRPISATATERPARRVAAGRWVTRARRRDSLAFCTDETSATARLRRRNMG
jgi:hypothetical protein